MPLIISRQKKSESGFKFIKFHSIYDLQPDSADGALGKIRVAVSPVSFRLNDNFVATLKVGSLALAAATLLTACTSTGFQRDSSFRNANPTSLVAAPTTQVESSALPGIGTGTDIAGDPWFTANASPINSESDIPNIVEDPTLPSIVDIPSDPNVAGRDLTGVLTKEKMIGGWTIASGQDTCRLFLTLTAKDNRYRAATPACESVILKNVATWQLVGNQVQLFNAAGVLIGNLGRAGDRFIGIMSGGVAASIYS